MLIVIRCLGEDLNLHTQALGSALAGEMLLSLGCDLAQGYAIASPMPAVELPEWVSNWKLKPLWSIDKAT
jgi:EAL domain-containing protein (putative c-di-GMP-specific phosphodiesterase class I)